MPFCHPRTDQIAALYGNVFGKVSQPNYDLLKNVTYTFETVLQKTGNRDLALTYASYVPEMVLLAFRRSIKPYRNNPLLKISAIEAIADKFRNSLTEVEEYLGIDKIANSEPRTAVSFNESKYLEDLVKRRLEVEIEAYERLKPIEDILEEEGASFENNLLNEKSAQARQEGRLVFVTFNPKEIMTQGDRLQSSSSSKDADDAYLRREFIDEISRGGIDNKRLLLSVTKQGYISGQVVELTKDGGYKHVMRKTPNMKKPRFISFLIGNEDMYKSENLSKSRQDVMKELKKGLKEILPDLENLPVLGFDNPLLLEEGDIISNLREIIKDGKIGVLATFEPTKGMLYRDGITNDLSVIPVAKPENLKSVKEFFDNNYVLGSNPVGYIPTTEEISNNIVLHKNRIHFKLKSNLLEGDKFEWAEFSPTNIGNVILPDGTKLIDSTIDLNGKKVNFFEAAIKGVLPSTNIYKGILDSVFRPSDFVVFEIGNNLMLINTRKFQQLGLKQNVTMEDIRNLSTIDDVKAAKLLIINQDYRDDRPSKLHNGSYRDFVHLNVYSSAKPVQIRKEIEGVSKEIKGFARVNRRLSVSLERSYIDLIQSYRGIKAEIPYTPVTEIKFDQIPDEFDPNDVIKTNCP